MGDMAKIFIIWGLVFLALGGLLYLSGKVPGIGKLPGDIYLRKGSFTFYSPPEFFSTEFRSVDTFALVPPNDARGSGNRRHCSDRNFFRSEDTHAL